MANLENVDNLKEYFPSELEFIESTDLYDEAEKRNIVNRCNNNLLVLEGAIKNKEWLKMALKEIGLEGLTNAKINVSEGKIRINTVRSATSMTYSDMCIPYKVYDEDKHDLIGTSMCIDLGDKMTICMTRKSMGLYPYLKPYSGSYGVQLDTNEINQKSYDNTLCIYVTDTQLVYNKEGKEILRADLDYEDRIIPSYELSGDPTKAPTIVKNIHTKYYSKRDKINLAGKMGANLTSKVDMFDISNFVEVRKRLDPYERKKVNVPRYEEGDPNKLLMDAIKYRLTIAVDSDMELSNNPYFREIMVRNCKYGFGSIVIYCSTNMMSEITGIGWGFSYEDGNFVRSESQAYENATTDARILADSKLKEERNHLAQTGGGRK